MSDNADSRHADVIRDRGVVHLALFGSLARGEAGPESDVDVVAAATMLPRLRDRVQRDRMEVF